MDKNKVHNNIFVNILYIKTEAFACLNNKPPQLTEEIFLFTKKINYLIQVQEMSILFKSI